MRVALLQCELEHRHQAPHLAMCLYANDLRRDGHEVECALVNPRALAEASRALADRCDFVVLDSIFPFAFVRTLRDGIGAPTLVGGHNALQHALRGPADLAIVGPGRQALRQVASALQEGDDPLRVAGVWARRSGVLGCGPPPEAVPPGLELSPFDPDFEWSYFGPPRAPGSNLRVPSLVAESGCVWNRSILGDGGFYEGVEPRLPDVEMTSAAADRIRQRFVRREGGCSFCVFRYTPPQRDDVSSTLDRLTEQAGVLAGLGADGASLQTENPFPYLPGLLDRLADRGLADRLRELHLRTIPWLVLRHEAELGSAIRRAEELGIVLVLGQVGFEAFDELGLAVYHKGLTGQDNRRAARLLGDLSRRHATFVGTAGHGLIPLHPWTTPAGLRTNLEACRQDAPYLLPSLSPGARVEFYDEWSPLFWKASDDGLVTPAEDRFGWDWTFADSGTGEIVAAVGALMASDAQPEPTTSSDLLGLVLDVFDNEPSPEARRTRYLAIRAEVRGASPSGVG